MKFSWQNTNDFKNCVRWHDYVAVMINEFPVILVRKYDWQDERMTTVLIQVLGFKLACKCYKWKD